MDDYDESDNGGGDIKNWNDSGGENDDVAKHRPTGVTGQRNNFIPFQAAIKKKQSIVS